MFSQDALDAGGVSRELYELASAAIFDVPFGLFQCVNGAGERGSFYRINPASNVANEEHLRMFRFAGRLIGKALFDGKSR